jgi:hypothetical protein
MRVPIYTAILPVLAGLALAQDTPPAQPEQPAAAPLEMKTQTYSGTLMDASCASGQSCGVSATTTQFALKMKDGNSVRFDDVGNARAQEALKTHKKWGDSAAANKPIQVKASGVMSGDKLTVLSVN